MNVLFLAEELRVGGAETYFYSLENNINRNDLIFIVWQSMENKNQNYCIHRTTTVIHFQC